MWTNNQRINSGHNQCPRFLSSTIRSNITVGGATETKWRSIIGTWWRHTAWYPNVEAAPAGRIPNILSSCLFIKPWYSHVQIINIQSGVKVTWQYTQNVKRRVSRSFYATLYVHCIHIGAVCTKCTQRRPLPYVRPHVWNYSISRANIWYLKSTLEITERILILFHIVECVKVKIYLSFGKNMDTRSEIKRKLNVKSLHLIKYQAIKKWGWAAVSFSMA